MTSGHHGSDKAAVTVSVVVSLTAAAAVATYAASRVLGSGMPAVSGAASGRKSKPALRAEEVKRDAEGRITNWPQLLKIVQQGGVAPEVRHDLWPVLLGVYDPSSTVAERAAELDRLQRLYTKLVLVCEELDAQIGSVQRAAASAAARQAPQARDYQMPVSRPATPEPATTLSGNLAAFADAHRIIVMDAVRTDMTQPCDTSAGGAVTGAAATARTTVTVLPVSVGDGLPELMLVDPPEPEPSAAVATGKLPVWRSALAATTISSAAHVAPPARRLMMRLVNLLSAYAVHDPETGYCQGMSDLAAVFVQLFDDDALAFACFERLMRDACKNFRHDESGIKAQLAQVGRIVADTDPQLHRQLQALGAGDCTFAYRMVLVMLRRELPVQEALTLWEAKWATEAGMALEDAAAAAARAAAGTVSPSLSASSLGSGSFSAPASAGGTPANAGLMSPMAALASTVASMDLAARAAVAEAASSNGGSRGSTPQASLQAARSGGSANGRRSGTGSATAARPPPDFLLQFVAAVVRSQRGRVMTECHDGDDVLRLFNSAVRIDFWMALAQARKQHKAYAQGIAVMQRL